MENHQERKPHNGGSIHQKFRADEHLERVTGEQFATRAQFVSLVWKYIKENNLQTKEDGRVIVPDETLSRVMGQQGEQINAFKMLKFIELHISNEQPAQQNEAQAEEATQQPAQEAPADETLKQPPQDDPAQVLAEIFKEEAPPTQQL